MNKYGCGPAALAKVIGVPVEQIYVEIGHDGSEIIFPDLPEPIRRRGFHPQELIDVALKYGWAVTEIQSGPTATTDGTNVYDVYADHESRMRNYLKNNQGILIGPRRVTRQWHYVAWINGMIHDGSVVPFEQCPVDVSSFFMFHKRDTRFEGEPW